MKLTIELGGGLELLFGKVASHKVDLPDKTSITIRDLLVYIKDHLIKERAELFVQDGNVRPGILVLVNDSDWELLDGLDTVLQPDDTVVFISTLHGG